jgi:GT2 family glycosyltransferase
VAARDPRAKAVRTPRNLGMAANANFAVARSTAPAIALLHHDDIYRADLLRRWQQLLDRYPDVGFVASGAKVYDSDALHVAPLPERTDGRELLERHLLRTWPCLIHGTAMIRRTAWNEVGGMREEFNLLADIDLWMRLAARYGFGYIAEPLKAMRHERPKDYPEAYQESYWSWPRVCLLYDIHATNLREHYGLDGARNQVRWLAFRLRVSAHMSKWMSYAVVKRRWDMLASIEQAANAFDLPPVSWTRSGLARTVRALRAP